MEVEAKLLELGEPTGTLMTEEKLNVEASGKSVTSEEPMDQEESIKRRKQDSNNNVGQVVTSPVLLPAVLELVFADMSLVDLHNCRQVSKLWYKEATRTLGLRLKIDINDVKSIESVLLKLKQQPRLRISELNVDNINLNEDSFQQLFHKSHLTLAVLRITDGQVTLANWYKMMRKAPNLVVLEIGALKDGESHLKLFPVCRQSTHEEMRFVHLRYLEFVSYGSPSSVFLSDVIRSCPNLKKLIAYNFPVENPKNFEGLKLPFLEVFYVPQLGGLGDTHVECLSKLNLSLRELMFNNFESELSPTLIRKFIESQNDTLKSLLLTQSRNDQDPFTEQIPSCPFPFKLSNLTYLEVEKPFVRNMSHVISTDAFPDLSHLYLRFHPGSNWVRCLPKNLRTHDGVHHLTIQWIEEKPLVQMAKAFPNLRALDIMYCDDNLLRVIYTHLPLLEILNVEDSEYRRITDEGLTGYSSGSNDESLRKWPYVGSLKNLHLLSLDFKFHPVTEKSILKGIVDATSLKVLRISGMQISSEVANVILEKLINLKTHCMHVEDCPMHEIGSDTEGGTDEDDDGSEASVLSDGGSELEA